MIQNVLNGATPSGFKFDIPENIFGKNKTHYGFDEVKIKNIHQVKIENRVKDLIDTRRKRRSKRSAGRSDDFPLWEIIFLVFGATDNTMKK